MNLGKIGPGCMECGAAEHAGIGCDEAALRRAVAESRVRLAEA